jgi:hypothetical protein
MLHNVNEQCIKQLGDANARADEEGKEGPRIVDTLAY